MSKLEIFWSFILLLLLTTFLAFICFVAYIYYDTALTMRAYAIKLSHKNKQLRKEIRDTNWIEIMDNAEEVI